MQNQQEENYNFTPMDSEKKIIGLSYKPTPSDRELEWDRTKVLLSKTDAKGNILYANEAFIDVCGYDDFELMDKSHNIVRHPDMPKVIFKIMWENLSKGNHFFAAFKNMAKTGRYYWIANDINTTTNDSGERFYTGKQVAINADVVLKHLEPLYKKLLQIEVASGVQSSENYLMGFLEERGRTYEDFIMNIISTGNDNSGAGASGTTQVNIPKKKGFFSGFFADDAGAAKKKK
jgi:PAS domain S-box-containing protein